MITSAAKAVGMPRSLGGRLESGHEPVGRERATIRRRRPGRGPRRVRRARCGSCRPRPRCAGSLCGARSRGRAPPIASRPMPAASEMSSRAACRARGRSERSGSPSARTRSTASVAMPENRRRSKHRLVRLRPRARNVGSSPAMPPSSTALPRSEPTIAMLDDLGEVRAQREERDRELGDVAERRLHDADDARARAGREGCRCPSRRAARRAGAAARSRSAPAASLDREVHDARHHGQRHRRRQGGRSRCIDGFAAERRQQRLGDRAHRLARALRRRAHAA